MQKYWLDWFVENLFEVRSGHVPFGMTRSQCAEIFFRKTVRDGAKLWQNPAIQHEESVRAEVAWLSEKIAPFAGIKRENSHLAVAVSRTPECHDLFPYTDVDIEQCGKAVALSHSVIYFDLAERVFMMPGGVLQVRSLFVWHDGQHFRFFAVLTRPGSNKGCLFGWREGCYARNNDDRRFDDVFVVNLDITRDRYRPINARKVDYEYFAEVEKLAWLSLANWKTVSDHGVPPMPQLPLPKVYGGQMLEEFFADDFAQEEPFSLFKVIRLPALGEFRIQQVRQRLSGMKQRPRKGKNREHEVDGHYRWQAYGPRRSLRKRIWIDGHRRGKEMAKAVMNVLPAANRLAA
jgi:hypothetical protein